MSDKKQEHRYNYVQNQLSKGRNKAIVYLSTPDQEFLKSLGDGNLSDGIRNLINLARAVNKG
jgi:hypothetical protein